MAPGCPIASCRGRSRFAPGSSASPPTSTALVDGDGRRGGLADAAIEVLKEHSGTWYDPLAVVHLESIVLDRPRSEWRTSRMQVGVDQLHEGMVLAADLSTSSGVKLLAKGATVTASMLDVIQRRHLADPIIDGVWIARR